MNKGKALPALTTKIHRCNKEGREHSPPVKSARKYVPGGEEKDDRKDQRSMGTCIPNYSALPIIKRLLGLENIKADRKRRRRPRVRKKGRGEKGRKRS